MQLLVWQFVDTAELGDHAVEQPGCEEPVVPPRMVQERVPAKGVSLRVVEERKQVRRREVGVCSEVEEQLSGNRGLSSVQCILVAVQQRDERLRLLGAESSPILT